MKKEKNKILKLLFLTFTIIFASIVNQYVKQEEYTSMEKMMRVARLSFHNEHIKIVNRMILNKVHPEEIINNEAYKYINNTLLDLMDIILNSGVLYTYIMLPLTPEQFVTLSSTQHNMPSQFYDYDNWVAMSILTIPYEPSDYKTHPGSLFNVKSHSEILKLIVDNNEFSMSGISIDYYNKISKSIYINIYDDDTDEIIGILGLEVNAYYIISQIFYIIIISSLYSSIVLLILLFFYSKFIKYKINKFTQ